VIAKKKRAATIMNSWLRRLLLAVAGIAAIPAVLAGADWLRPPLDRAGSLVWEMDELHIGYTDRRLGRTREPDRALADARNTAAELAERRDSLARLLPTLEPSADFTRQLREFLAKWPNEEAFLQDLLAFDTTGSRTGYEITSLALKAPDKRIRWKTPLPIQRP
jgi:hypothetical protein